MDRNCSRASGLSWRAFVLSSPMKRRANMPSVPKGFSWPRSARTGHVVVDNGPELLTRLWFELARLCLIVADEAAREHALCAEGVFVAEIGAYGTCSCRQWTGTAHAPLV